MAHELDFSPLAERPRLRDRWADVATNNGLVLGVVIGVGLLGVGVPGLVVRLADRTTRAGEDTVWLFAFLTVCGAFTVVGIFWATGHGAALARFADANDLESLHATAAPEYAAGVFASGLHTVNDAVRTRDERFVEVGERFPTGTAPNPRDPKSQMVYLRARLRGRVTGPVDDEALVTRELREALTAWAGPWSVDVRGDELTVLGSKPLLARRDGRVEEGFRLVRALVERAETVLALDEGPARPVVTASGVTVPVLPASREVGRPTSPLRVVLGFLALMVVGPLAIAIVMSAVDGALRGRAWAAEIVVSLVVGATLLGVGAFMRWLLAPCRTAPDQAAPAAGVGDLTHGGRGPASPGR